MTYLSNYELLLATKDLAYAFLDAELANNVSVFTRKLSWWRDLQSQLEMDIRTEQEYYSEHKDEYFLPLTEVAYYDHWISQLDYVNRILTLVDKKIRSMYGFARKEG